MSIFYSIELFEKLKNYQLHQICIAIYQILKYSKYVEYNIRQNYMQNDYSYLQNRKYK